MTADVPATPPQLLSGPLVISQIAICGLSVVISPSKVPLNAGWATMGGRKKKPGVPPSWTPSEIANTGLDLGAVGRSPDAHASTIRRADMSQASRRVSSTAIFHPWKVRMVVSPELVESGRYPTGCYRSDGANRDRLV